MSRFMPASSGTAQQAALATLAASTAVLSAVVVWLGWHVRRLELGRRPTYPRKIILVRHAESAGNVDVDAYRTIGDPLIPLTQRGRAQARVMAEHLRDLVGDRRIWAFTSPYLRSRETATIALSAFDASTWRLVEDPRLREQEFAGGFQHSVPDRTEQRLYGKFFWRFPGGESAADVYDRLSMFMDTLWRDMMKVDLSDSVVVIFAHGLTNRLFCMRWLHWSPRVYEQTRNPPNCGFIVLDLQPADATGHPYYRLTPDSIAMLGLQHTEAHHDFAESAPSTWAMSRLYDTEPSATALGDVSSRAIAALSSALCTSPRGTRARRSGSSLYTSASSAQQGLEMRVKWTPPTIAGGSGWSSGSTTDWGPS